MKRLIKWRCCRHGDILRAEAVANALGEEDEEEEEKKMDLETSRAVYKHRHWRHRLFLFAPIAGGGLTWHHSSPVEGSAANKSYLE